MPTVVPGSTENRPLHANRFVVEIKNPGGTKISGVFTEASGLSIDIKEATSETTGAGGEFTRTVASGTVEYSDITLKREFKGERDFYTWCAETVAQSEEIRGEGSIVVYLRGDTEASRWNIKACWPSKWSVSDVDVGSDDVMIEEVTLQIEQLERAS